MQEIEGIQRTFTSHIRDVKNLNYWQRLVSLNIYSIERRYERYLIIYAWKIIENIYMCAELFCTTASDSRTGRQFNIGLQSKKALETPFTRAKRAFNSLPKDLRNLTGVDVDCFKKHLDSFLSAIPDQPNVPGYGRFRASCSNSVADQYKYKLMGGDIVMASSSASC